MRDWRGMQEMVPQDLRLTTATTGFTDFDSANNYRITGASPCPPPVPPVPDSSSTGFSGNSDMRTMRYQYVYSSLDNKAMSYPTISKMVTDLSTLLKNGYKMIHSIASLPAPDRIFFYYVRMFG